LQLICCRLPQEAGVSLTLAAALFLSQVRDHGAPPPSVTQFKPRPPIIHTYNLRSVRGRTSIPIIITPP
jgi:hypothetical protein